jgi:ribonuclease HII
MAGRLRLGGQAPGVIFPLVFVYAGIDEAGYGPLLGPLVVSRSVMTIPRLTPDAAPPRLWQRLSKAVCRDLSKRNGRVPVNDSKKLTTKAAGLKHLELGCLSFAHAAGHAPGDVGQWLTAMGTNTDREVTTLPWYQPTYDRPWQPLPTAITEGELSIGASLLGRTTERIGVHVNDLNAAVVAEDHFNRMVAATRSKASTSFTFVAGHLRAIWDQYAANGAHAFVDRQSGRSHYREPLQMNFPEAALTVIEEGSARSVYRLTEAGRQGAQRAMTVQFETEADGRHMPVALASMISKYSRELLMRRFNDYFQSRVPQLAPTAGYAQDAKRFLAALAPHLDTLGITRADLCRQA